jgi:glycosyltransferase involved in cell wall biosynthesis
MLNALTRHFSLRVRCEVIENGRTLDDASRSYRYLRAITAGRLWDEAKDIGILGEVSSPIPLFAAGPTEHGSVECCAALGDVTLLGRLCEEELLEFFRESAIYICTSRYEPFGLAALEAALCGCAVVARDIGSLREVWADAALFFADSASLSSLLHRLHSHPEALFAAQQRSKARARCFTSERMVQSYHALFARTIQEMEAGTYAA